MAPPDALALPQSSLNPFLFAGVGTETNGSELTILSLLARLGSDPWAEAGRLAALPRAAAADWLVDRISTMPLTADALSQAGATGSRLVLLLPSQGTSPVIAAAPTLVQAGTTPLPQRAIVALIWGALALAVMAGALHSPASQVPPVGTANHAVQHDQ